MIYTSYFTDLYVLMMIAFARRNELDSMRERLLSLRRTLYNAVVNEYQVSSASVCKE